MDLSSARIRLCCTVRGCGSVLSNAKGALACDKGHSFDIAKSGYVNLLQPQDRRSKHPGDSRTAVSARRRLIAKGHASALSQALKEIIATALPDARAGGLEHGRAGLLDAGCGEGSWLADLASSFEIEAWGADISVEAIDRAARAHANARWIVTNVDRRLPFEDWALDCVVSVHARVNAEEFARVLVPGGAFVVVVPGPDDLGELRSLVQGRADERDRLEKLRASLEAGVTPGLTTRFTPRFTMERRVDVRDRRRVDAEDLADLLETTYRGGRRRPERLAGVAELDVTWSHAVALFRSTEPEQSLNDLRGANR